MAEDLDDFGLRRRIVFERAADQFPGLLDRSLAIEQADEAVGGIGKPMILIARGVADDVPSLPSIKLPRNLRARPQLGAKVRHAIPGLGKCGSKLKRHGGT